MLNRLALRRLLTAISWGGRTILRFYTAMGTGAFLSRERFTIFATIVGFLVAKKLGVAGRWDLPLYLNGKKHVWTLKDRADLSVLEEVFLDEEYALQIAPPRVVFDLGANIGAASIYFAIRWPEAKIYAVEPNPAVYARLLETTANYAMITCLNYAVSDSDGHAGFGLGTHHMASRLSSNDEGIHQIIDVETKKLSSLTSMLGVEYIDMMKFDVEGAEEAIFRDQSFAQYVGNLIGEVHKEMLLATEEEFLNFFEGYEVQKRYETDEYFVMSARKQQ